MSQNNFKSILAMTQRAKDLTNGEMPKEKINSDNVGYIAYCEFYKGVLDEDDLFKRFVNQDKYVEDDDDDEYKA
ncbi:hypothetical protein FZC35_00035 [Candidatus Cytomitobacter indipagum]|uniref:Uncharacterized protein n=1 Tax=Candidatus Cytomitobacter indipagum TaxID=2601575 RepID=A0A5C0UDG7_9PROT|nr:hypothetical protein [Candidatus Cytomitobacter indipagum]QEK37787.1 hypothetical protein FZC35_00035 [Candidatus Cytomitobacter indipagum]